MQRVIGLIVFLIALYIIIYGIYPGSNSNDILKNKVQLNDTLQILTSDVVKTKLLNTTGSTVMGFFYLLDGDKTINFTNSFIPIMKVDNNWYLEIAHSSNGVNSSSARLRIQTNDNGKLNNEIIALPPIPKQKWMLIAILRDGRRFDVIYDNKIVASDILEYYPAVISSPLSVGNKGVGGYVMHVLVNSIRVAPSDIERDRLSFIDTNGVVIDADKTSISLPGFKILAQCPPGLPCDAITKPPTNNLLQWNTPYA